MRTMNCRRRVSRGGSCWGEGGRAYLLNHLEVVVHHEARGVAGRVRPVQDILYSDVEAAVSGEERCCSRRLSGRGSPRCCESAPPAARRIEASTAKVFKLVCLRPRPERRFNCVVDAHATQLEATLTRPGNVDFARRRTARPSRHSSVEPLD